MIRATGEFALMREGKTPLRARNAVTFAYYGALLLLVVVSAGVLAGCGATRPSKYYQLTVPDETFTAPARDAVAATLLVGNLLTSHLYREDRIVYSGHEGQMGTYEYQRWAEPPTEMIEEILVHELRASGKYKAVYQHRSNTGGDFLVHGRLYDFKEVSGSPLAARLNFELEMRDLKNGAMVWAHSYSHDEPVDGKDVASIAAALDRNVQRGVKEMVGSLGEYFAAHPVK